MNASFLLEQMVSLHGGGLGGEVALDALDISPDGDARAVLVTVVGARVGGTRILNVQLGYLVCWSVLRKRRNTSETP